MTSLFLSCSHLQSSDVPFFYSFFFLPFHCSLHLFLAISALTIVHLTVRQIVIYVAAGTQGRHVAALCANGLSYSWGCSANSKLRHRDTAQGVVCHRSDRQASCPNAWPSAGNTALFSPTTGQPTTAVDLGTSLAVRDLAADDMQSVFLHVTLFVHSAYFSRFRANERGRNLKSRSTNSVFLLSISLRNGWFLKTFTRCPF